MRTRVITATTVSHLRRRYLALAGLGAGAAQGAPIDGELGSNAAALLVLLGIWALLMGLRNLREMRHKRLTPERRVPDNERQKLQDD